MEGHGLGSELGKHDWSQGDSWEAEEVTGDMCLHGGSSREKWISEEIFNSGFHVFP